MVIIDNSIDNPGYNFTSKKSPVQLAIARPFNKRLTAYKNKGGHSCRLSAYVKPNFIYTLKDYWRWLIEAWKDKSNILEYKLQLVHVPTGKITEI
jgi:hypothetical protein